MHNSYFLFTILIYKISISNETFLSEYIFLKKDFKGKKLGLPGNILLFVILLIIKKQKKKMKMFN